MVAETDRAARDYCRTAGTNDNTPPHAVYGELWDLAYKCSNGRSSRLPVDMALDREGYVRLNGRHFPKFGILCPNELELHYAGRSAL
jgi:hypothetical protein